MKTTFRKLKEAGACTARYRHLAKSLGGITKYGRDTPISALQILDHNGSDDLWWAWRFFDKTKADKIGRLFAADCAERVLPLFEKERPNDDRPRKAIEACRQFANGEIDAAASEAARAAAWEAAWAAASEAAMEAARAAARAAAWAAAWEAEKEWQLERLRWYLEADQ